MHFYAQQHAADVNQLDGSFNYTLYEQADTAGRLLCVMLVDRYGFGIGYHIASVYTGVNRPGLMAQTHAVFIDPKHRSFKAHRLMQNFVESRLREKGVERLYTGLSAQLAPRQIPLFERAGYRQSEIVMEKAL